MKTKQDFTLDVGGQTFTATFGDLADQAPGAVMLKCNETVLFATAVMSKDRAGTSWFNLTVDFQEKFYAGGQILGGRYRKREGRPSDEAVLASRVIDRTMRPLFDHRNPHSVQIIVQVWALDHTVDLVTMAVNAASIALHTSDIPWDGPVGAVRYGMKEGAEVLNSSLQSRTESYDYDLVVCGRQGKINMIEADAFETPEADLSKGFEASLLELTKFENWAIEMQKIVGKEKRDLVFEATHPSLVELFDKQFYPRFPEYITSGKPGKETINALHEEWKVKVEEIITAGVTEDEEELIRHQAHKFYDGKMDDFIHEAAIERDMRADGRTMDQVRDIYAQAGNVSKRLHGSGIFYRGGTHVFTALTLGGPETAQLVESMEFQEEKRFMHHYNFPPFSAGETGRAGFTNRREIGHGALAEKALSKVLPTRDVFPYTIRLVSESMASNGSTSQASMCASTIALMDGGVPITAPVAGLAMGLMYKDDSNYKVLSDIQGPEDHYGDMDFKVAGTRKGVCAIQLDVKLDGVSPKILNEAMAQGRIGREGIIDVIEAEISTARPEISEFAPKIISVMINPDLIGRVIGSGGKTVTEIREKSQTEIQIEEDGQIFITGLGDGPEKAKAMIEELTKEFNKGEKMEGVITKVMDFGAFVRLNSFTEGMVHVSEIAPFRVEKVSDFLTEGQTVPVVVIKTENGKIGLSIKEANKDLFKPKESATPKPPVKPAQ
jgi:polyribonucleotide nucleotidyltransferase